MIRCRPFAPLLAIAAFVAAGPAVAADDERPNIVLVLADDLGWSDLGCYGGEIPTPHVDRLAAGGLRYTQVYNNAVCGPSRASLLTGLYCQRIGHGGRHWNEPTDFTRSATVAELLQAAGYRTMMVGKWQERELPAKRGFDRFFGPMCAGRISYFHEVQNNPYYLDTTRYRLPADFYLTDALTDFAVEFVREAVDAKRGPRKPFFLYVAHIAPHWPLHAREADVAPHRARYLEKGWDAWRTARLAAQQKAGLVPAELPLAARPTTVPAWIDDENKAWQAERMAVYSAQVASIDRSVGRILDALRTADELDNTLVLFLSDNGPAPDGPLRPTARGNVPPAGWRLDGTPIRPGAGPQNMPGPADTFDEYGLGWATLSATPWRGTKLTGYEGGIRTPLVAHWPAGIRERGGIVHDVGHVVDLLPTCLDAAGAAYPKQFADRTLLPLDGRSLAPSFRGELPAPRDLLAWHVPKHRVLRRGDWKLVGPDQDGPWELYDLTRDPTESNDLAAKRPEIVTELAAKWRAWADDCAGSQNKTAAKSGGGKQSTRAPQVKTTKQALDVVGELAAKLTADRIVPYKKIGGRELQLHLFEPAGSKPGDKRACFVVIHGGGWTGGEPQRMYPFAAHFAERGMLGVSVQYRLASPKLGTTPFDCVRDGRSSVRYLKAHADELGIDPQRIVVAGGSAGGHVAVGTALFDDVDDPQDDLKISPTPAALVLLFPVIDTSPAGYGNAKCGPKWREISPLHQVRRGLPPTIVFHGTADVTTPFAGAKAFDEAMRAAGNRCELVVDEGGVHGHLMRDRAKYDDALGRTERFLESLGLIETRSSK